MPAKFGFYLAILSIWLLAELGVAYFEKYGFKFQVLEQTPVPRTYLTFWGNLAMWGCFIIVNPILAYVLGTHAKSWSLESFAIIFVVAGIVCTLARIPLLQDSLTTPSALFKDGLSPLAGVMEYLYQVVAYSIIGAYYIFHSRGQGTAWKWEMGIITVLLMIHWGIAVMHPPYAVRGAVHLPAKVMAAGGCILLAVVAGYLILFA